MRSLLNQPHKTEFQRLYMYLKLSYFPQRAGLGTKLSQIIGSPRESVSKAKYGKLELRLSITELNAIADNFAIPVDTLVNVMLDKIN